MHEMVKYHNDLNTVPMRKFSEIELNIFMAVVQQMRDKSTNKIQLSFDRLKELSNWKIRRKDDAEFAKHLHSVAEKLIHLSGTRWSPDGKSFDMFILFTRFKASSEQQTLDVSVNPEFEYILNDFAGGPFRSIRACRICGPVNDLWQGPIPSTQTVSYDRLSEAIVGQIQRIACCAKKLHD